jgi:catechol 2,3-dioxygenase-like lactoylglutathione lyase family enzyme
VTIDLQKSAIDLGIVIQESERSLAFYRDLLGFKHEADTPMPLGSGGVMHRLWCGDSMIKLVCFNETPEARPPKGGIDGATGYRYWTMQVNNLDEIMRDCEAAGVKVAVPVTELAAGVRIGIVRDPDGNLVEFVQR